jgi:hypothetical protein
MIRRLRRAREHKVLQIELLEANTPEVSNQRSPETFAGFYANYAKYTFRAMHGDFP